MSDFDRKSGGAALIAALAAGQTVRDAAATVGLSESTVYRRLADPAFQEALTQARSAMLGQAIGQLADTATAAVSTLRGLLGAESESVRLGAARAVLELGSKLRESEDLAARVAILEQAQREIRPQGRKQPPWRSRLA